MIPASVQEILCAFINPLAGCISSQPAYYFAWRSLAPNDAMQGFHQGQIVFKNRPMDAREIGRQLQVSALLEGSVRNAGDRVRVTVQLIDAQSGRESARGRAQCGNGWRVWSKPSWRP
jgi:hypothetical protein